MTILEIIQHFCSRTGLTTPTAVFGSQDDQVIQLVALANECIDDLTTRHIWQSVLRECLHTSLATSDQGDINVLAASGFQYIIDNRIYDRTSGLLLQGPVSPADWQAMQAGVGIGMTSWRLRGNHLLFYPVLPAGHTIAFEYASNYLVKDTTSTLKPYFTKDDDTFELPDALVLLWLRWRWKKEKGFSYDEEFRLYEAALINLSSHDGDGKILDMGAGSALSVPGIFISPSGTQIG